MASERNKIIFSAVEDLLAEHGVEDASTLLSELGFAVEWEGLTGGTVRRTDEA